YFHREHNQMSTRLGIVNHDFFSKLTFILVCVNIPSNVIFAYRFVFVFECKLIVWDYPISPFEPLFIIIIMILQMDVITNILFPLAKHNAEIDRTAKYLPSLILRIGRDCLAFKLKFEDLYARLVDSEIKIGSTLGPNRTITF